MGQTGAVWAWEIPKLTEGGALISSQVTRPLLHLHKATAYVRNYRSSFCPSIYRSVWKIEATSFGETTEETLDPYLFSFSSPKLQLPDKEPLIVKQAKTQVIS